MKISIIYKILSYEDEKFKLFIIKLPINYEIIEKLNNIK
jgi:hypothetical protein